MPIGLVVELYILVDYQLVREIVTYINEANILRKHLNTILEREGGGKVIDIQFIPDYKTLLELEREKNEIKDLKNLISKKETSFIRKWLFPYVYRTEKNMEKRLREIEVQFQDATERPVLSSGHAFLCFDSLLSAYICEGKFREKTFKKLKIQMKSIFDNVNNKFNRKMTSTFGKFDDELDNEILEIENLDILVDQMIEPEDIIWSNVGGDRGVRICRRILCNIAVVLVLLFLTTPTVYYSNIDISLCCQIKH
jgi:hypothetical protein